MEECSGIRNFWLHDEKSIFVNALVLFITKESFGWKISYPEITNFRISYSRISYLILKERLKKYYNFEITNSMLFIPIKYEINSSSNLNSKLAFLIPPTKQLFPLSSIWYLIKMKTSKNFVIHW